MFKKKVFIIEFRDLCSDEAYSNYYSACHIVGVMAGNIAIHSKGQGNIEVSFEATKYRGKKIIRTIRKLYQGINKKIKSQ